MSSNISSSVVSYILNTNTEQCVSFPLPYSRKNKEWKWQSLLPHSWALCQVICCERAHIGQHNDYENSDWPPLHSPHPSSYRPAHIVQTSGWEMCVKRYPLICGEEYAKHTPERGVCVSFLFNSAWEASEGEHGDTMPAAVNITQPAMVVCLQTTPPPVTLTSKINCGDDSNELNPVVSITWPQTCLNEGHCLTNRTNIYCLLPFTDQQNWLNTFYKNKSWCLYSGVDREKEKRRSTLLCY